MTGTYIWIVSLCVLVIVLLFKKGVFHRQGLHQAIPQLPYLDEEQTISFYRDVLKFDIMSQWEGYIITKKDNVEIHLWKTDNPVIPKNTGCYVRVNKNIEELYADYHSKGIMHEHGKLEVKPWKMKQFSVLDNSGNIIHFGQDVSSVI